MAGTSAGRGVDGDSSTGVRANRKKGEKDTYWFDELSKISDGEWVCFPEFGDRFYAFAVVRSLRDGRWELPEGEWEFRAEGSKILGKSWVYARRVS